MAGTKPPIFLSVKAGDWVIVEGEQQVAQQFNESWWMGQDVFCEGGARDPRVNTMFQVSNVDVGCIMLVNGDEVTHVVRSLGASQVIVSSCNKQDLRIGELMVYNQSENH
jgi:hypothetical protein